MRVFQVNRNEVVKESFDEEVILIQMQTGKYFSLRGSGQAIWDLIEKGCASDEISKHLIATCDGNADEIQASVATLLDDLSTEGLITPAEGTGAIVNGATPAGPKKPFVVPILERYTDMQDLLLLDPIHEVDETGWPDTQAGKRKLGMAPAGSGVPDPDKFFADALAAFERAAAGRLLERHYRVGGKTVLVRFAGTSIVPVFTPAIEHLSAEPCATPDLTVHVFDEKTTHGGMPPAPWAPEAHGQRGLIDGYNDARFFTTYEVGIDILQMFDAERKAAIYWVRDPEWIPYWETSFPMRSVLHWRFRNDPLQPIHAGAVGDGSGGVLIAGKSGSGKSTSTLACLLNGLLYAGDDYVLAGMGDVPYVHSLYSTAKLVPENQERFPQLRPLVSNPDKLEREKALIFLRDHFPGSITCGFPLRAILLPRVTGLRDTRLTKAGAMDAYRAIVPTTVLHLPRISDEAGRKINALCRSLPVYFLEAGTDLPQIPRVIRELLSGHP